MGEVRYVDDDYDVTFVVKSATVRDGVRLAVAIREIRERQEAPTPDDWGALFENLLCIHDFPCALTVTTEVRNNDEDKPKRLVLEEMRPEDMLDLPDALVNIWLDEVWRRNPHWAPRVSEDSEGNAKEPGAESGSMQGSAPGSKRKRTKGRRRTSKTGTSTTRS